MTRPPLSTGFSFSYAWKTTGASAEPESAGSITSGASRKYVPPRTRSVTGLNGPAARARRIASRAAPSDRSGPSLPSALADAARPDHWSLPSVAR